MIGNSRVPGIAAERPQRAFELQNLAIHDVDEAMRYATAACVPGEYSSTLLPSLLWALDKAVTKLTDDEHLIPGGGVKLGWRRFWNLTQDDVEDIARMRQVFDSGRRELVVH